MMSRKRYLCIILFLVVGMTALAQDTTSVRKTNFIRRYWQSLIHGNVDRTHEKAFDVSFAVAPSYSREGGFGFGGTATGLYRVDRRDSTMIPSNITFGANASLKGFYSLIANGTNYFSDKHSKLVYSAKFTRKVLDFWGIQFDECSVNPTSGYVRTQFRIDADHSYRIGTHVYFGAVLNMNYTKAGRLIDPDYLSGQNPDYFLTGIGASFQYDSRDNPTNTHKGLYILLRETVHPKFLGTASMTNWGTTFTLCGYQPLWKGGLIAGDLYAQFNSENAPWILREELGGVTGRMRGYYAGRYIDSNQISAQVELRQHIASRFGCVAWVGAGTVFPSLSKFEWKNVLPNYGIGLRVEFKHNMNIRIDFGFGKETAGLCFGFAEAF